MTEDYALPPDLVLLATEQSWEIRKSLEQVTGGYLTNRHITAIRFDTKGGPQEISASEVARFLGQLRPMALDSAEPIPARPKIISLTGGVGAKLTEFIELFFLEIRNIICKDQNGHLYRRAPSLRSLLIGLLPTQGYQERSAMV